MASNQVLPSAKSLSGQWTIIDKSDKCIIHFSSERLNFINGYKLSTLSNCPYNVLPQYPAAWRPTPDGIALLDHNGLTILFFSREGDIYRSQTREPTGKILEKRKS